MTRVRELRLWTALIVVALSALAIARGWTAMRLGIAELTLDRQSAEADLAPFLDDAAVGVVARRDLLGVGRDSDPAARAKALGELLARAPLSSGGWLDLAVARRAAGGSTESVVTALALSSVTGPNESNVMAARAAFAAPFWSALPPSSRKSLIGDLIGGWVDLEEADRVRLRAVLQSAPEGSGEAVRAALLLRGQAGAAIAAALFPAPPLVAPSAGAQGAAP